MAQAYPLDRVIQRVSADAPPPGAAQRLVVIDAKTEQATGKPRFWSLGDLRYYLVSNHNDLRNAARLEIPHLPVSDLGHTVAVSVTLQLSCPAGREERVAEALFDAASSPTEVLERHLGRWLAASSHHDVPAFVRRYFEEPAALEDALATAVLRDTGLDAKVRLSLDAERSLNPIRVEVTHLPVLVRDYAEEQDLKLRVDLEVDEAHKAAALLFYPRNLELQHLVPVEVKRFLRRQVSMQEFCTDLGNGRTPDGLIVHLDEALKPAGRRVGAVVLQTKLPDDLRLSFQEQMDVICEVREFPQPVIVNNKVLMLLKDLAKYRAAGSPDLQSWLRAKLSRFIPQLLFEARYIDLLIRFQQREMEIKQRLSEEAATIGYEIKQLITVPDLAPIRLRDNFTLDTVGTFETKQPNVHVKLHIVVTTRIPRLETVEEYLNRHQDVPTLMQDAILNEARQALHKIEPERFYLWFSHADPDHDEDGLSVEAQLVQLIKAKLKGPDFRAEVIDVVIKMVETDLIERLRGLQERMCPFEVEVSPFHGGPAIAFKGTLRVTAVDSKGWHRFQLSNCALEEIKAHVENHMLTRLSTIPPDLLIYKREADRAEIEARLAELARDYAVREFGLAIEVTSVQRGHTELERAAAAIQVEREQAALRIGSAYVADEMTAFIEINRARVDQIQKLLEQRTALTGADGADQEVAELDQKIAAAQKELAGARIPSSEEVEQALLRAPTAANLLEAFANRPALPETVATPQERDKVRDQ